MRKISRALLFVFSLALAIYVGRELLHWASTGELASIAKGGGESRTLNWDDEPGYFIFIAVVRIGEFFAGVWGMIATARGDWPAQQAPE